MGVPGGRVRVLALVLVLAACRDHGGPSARPGSGSGSGSGSAGAPGHPIATLRSLAAEVCACPDPACRDRVSVRWKAALGAGPAFKDPATMSLKEIADEVADGAAYQKVRATYLGCLEPDHGPDRMRARLGAYADRACTCDHDPGCLAEVKTEEDHYLEAVWEQQDGFTDLDRQQITAEMRRFAICAAPPAP